jgi:hypothetical protein
VRRAAKRKTLYVIKNKTSESGGPIPKAPVLAGDAQATIDYDT